MLPTELQARLLLELLQESSWTKHIQLAVTWPLQHQIHLQWFAHLVSPVSSFWSFCLIFRSGSQTASRLTFLQYTSSWGQKSCRILTSAEDRFSCQNFLDLFLTLVGTSATPPRWASDSFYLLEKSYGLVLIKQLTIMYLPPANFPAGSLSPQIFCLQLETQ